MDNTYVPRIGDNVFLHPEEDTTSGSFFKVLDVNGDTMAIQACAVVGDHLEEINKLDIVLLN